MLVGLPHLSFDPQQSRGSTTTFTERWGDFLAGTGPPPAPSPAAHTSYCRTGPSSCGGDMSSQHASAHPAGQHMQEACCAGDYAACSCACSQGPAQQPCAVFSPLLQPFVSQQHGAASIIRPCSQGGMCSGSGAIGSQSQQGAGLRSAGFSSSGAGAGAGAGPSSMQHSLTQQLNRPFFPALLGGQQGAAAGSQHWVQPASPELMPAGLNPGRVSVCLAVMHVQRCNSCRAANFSLTVAVLLLPFKG